MIKIKKQIFNLINSSVYSDQKKLKQLVQLLLNCNGSFVLVHGKIQYIDYSSLDSYFSTKSSSMIMIGNNTSGNPYQSALIEAIHQKEEDLHSIQYIIKILNDNLHGDDMLIFYENYFLKQSYSAIHHRYGFSRNKCSSASHRNLKSLQSALFINQ